METNNLSTNRVYSAILLKINREGDTMTERMKNNIKRICLVRTACSTFSEPELPLNFLILGSCLENEGYNVELRDYDVVKFKKPEILGNDENAIVIIAKDIMLKNPDCALFTCMCNNFARTMSIIKFLKQLRPSIITAIGGPHVSMCAKETMEAYHNVLDMVMIGEGEKTVVEVINCLENKQELDNVKGICIYKDNTVLITPKRELLQNLDESPIPAYHLVNINDYNNITGKTSVYVGSGCPFACNFCTTSLMWERRYRVKSVERVIEELKILKYQYKKNDFVFIHDNLTASKKYIVSLLSAIKNANLEIEYEISSRIDTIDEETIKLFSESGGKTIFFGIETGSTRMQEVIGKKLSLDDVTNILNICGKYGVEASTSFIIGFPDETREDMEKTIKLAFRCRTILEDRVGINLLSIYPGSPLSYSAYESLYLDEINYEYPMYQSLSTEELKDIRKYKFIYSNYYLYKKYSNGLSAVEMRELFDFVTIIIEKYPYMFNYLLNILNYSIIDIFKLHKYTLNSLSLYEKDNLKYKILIDKFLEDLDKVINSKYREQIVEWYRYDTCINEFYQQCQINNEKLYSDIFKVNVDIQNNNIINRWIYYLVIAKNSELYNIQISQDIYNKMREINDNEKEITRYLNEELGMEI